MEPSTITIRKSILFVHEIKEDDLKELKEDADGKFKWNSSLFYDCKIYGIKYWFTIKSNAHKRVFFHMNARNGTVKNFDTEWSLSIESAKFAQSCNFGGNSEWKAILLGKVEDFFDLKKKFFVNGILRVKVSGTLTFEHSTVSKISYPISLKWTIKESDLLPLKTSTSNSYLKSKRFNISSDSDTDTKYYLRIYPNGASDEQRGKVGTFLQIEVGKEKKLEAFYDISIKSADFVMNFGYAFEKSEGFGTCFTSEELFDPSKKFIVDGKLEIQVDGIFFIEKKSATILTCKKGIAPKKSKTMKNKDFTIVVETTEITVHKDVLRKCSPYFVAMFASGMKEAEENRMEIKEFSVEVVRAAINLIYSSGVSRTMPYENMLSLLQFADMYDIQLVKDLVEEYLIKKISPSNVCQLINFSPTVNATKLHQCCCQFLVQCSKDSVFVCNLDSLDEQFFRTLFMGTFVQTSETVLFNVCKML